MKHLDDEIFFWEELYGTDTIEWFPKYKLHLPYWVAYMPEKERKLYVNEIRKTRDWGDNVP